MTSCLRKAIQELRKRLLTRVWILAKRPHDDLRKIVGHLCAPAHRLKKWWLLVHVLHQDRSGGMPVERQLSCEQLIGQDTEGVNVASLIGCFPGCRFGRYVRCGPKYPSSLRRYRPYSFAFEHAGNSEVYELHEVVVRSAPHQIDILGLDVTVNDPSRVNRAKAGAELHDHDQGALQRWQSALVELVGERPAFEQLHHDVKPPIAEPPRKKDPNEVGVIERDRKAGFALEAKDGLFVTRQLEPQHLDGYVATYRRLARAIYRPHATGTDLLIDMKLLEQDGSEQRICDVLVCNQKAAVVRAVFGAAPELRTAAKANLPHVG